jgi:hypothetical protein
MTGAALRPAQGADISGRDGEILNRKCNRVAMPAEFDHFLRMLHVSMIRKGARRFSEMIMLR